jgi:hypothetical protein
VDDTPTTITEAFASPDTDDWKEAFQMIWTQFFQMVHRRSLIDPMVVNMWVVSGCLKRSSSLMVQSRSTRLGLWLKAMLRKKENTSLILTHLLLECLLFEYCFPWLTTFRARSIWVTMCSKFYTIIFKDQIRTELYFYSFLN